MLMPVQPPPGVRDQGTDLENSGRWIDASLVRWQEGSIRPVGGWRALETAANEQLAIPQNPTGSHAWTDNQARVRAAFGSHSSLTVIQLDGVSQTITPASYNPGNPIYPDDLGYGTGAYGRGPYGRARTARETILVDATGDAVWTMGNWGQNLIVCTTAGGKIYQWVPGQPLAVELPNAPANNEAVVVTDERFVMAIGAGGNPRKVRWCDQENNTSWALPGSDDPGNQAGELELVMDGALLAAVKVRGRLLLLSTSDAFLGEYQGQPFIYHFERIGNNVPLIGPRAAAGVSENAYWMGDGAFYWFDGNEAKELPCDVRDRVFGDINLNYKNRVFAVSNQRNSEVWWFYPSEESKQPDRYVAFNYLDGIWMCGIMYRSAGVDSGLFPYPLGVDQNGAVWLHEIGTDHQGSIVYVETGPLILGAGDNLMSVMGIITDDETYGSVDITLKARNYPQGDETEKSYTLTDNGKPLDTRITGRQIRMRVEGLPTSGDWRLGAMRMDVRERGRR